MNLEDNNLAHSDTKQTSDDKENVESFRQMKLQFAKKMSLETRKKILNIQQCLQTSIERISFSKVIPGNICEEEICFVNISSQNIIVQINVVCYNKEYDPLDEYVFSARKIQGFDYNDKIFFSLSPNNEYNVKIALKAPNDKANKIIYGEVFISATQTDNNQIQGAIRIPIETQLEMPSITCPKMLFSREMDCQLVPLAFKLGKKLECKIPFKNNSNLIITVECDQINTTDDFPYEIMTTLAPQSVQSQNQFFITVNLKAKSNKIQRKDVELRQVLTLKLKNTSVYFGFPLLIRIC